MTSLRSLRPLTYLIYFVLYAPRGVMPMSSTTVLSPVYSDCDFAPAAANWLTYACVPIADLAALLLTALLSEAVCYLFFGRFAFTNYMHFAPCVLIFYAVFALAGLYPGFPINPIEEFRLTLRAVGLSFLIITGGTFLMGSSPLLCLILVIFRMVARVCSGSAKPSRRAPLVLTATVVGNPHSYLG